MTTALAGDYEPRSAALARRVRGLMAEMQIRQIDIAEQLGLTQAGLSRRSRGFTPFRVDEVELLAQVLGVSEAYLYGFTDDRSDAPMGTTAG